jgi:hypothetical protein
MMPVTLPFDTISWRDNSVIVMPLVTGKRRHDVELRSVIANFVRSRSRNRARSRARRNSLSHSRSRCLLTRRVTRRSRVLFATVMVRLP